MPRSAAHLRYLGCKQNLGHPVNDLFDLRVDAAADGDGAESDGPEPLRRLETLQQKIECQRADSECERVSAGPAPYSPIQSQKD